MMAFREGRLGDRGKDCGSTRDSATSTSNSQQSSLQTNCSTHTTPRRHRAPRNPQMRLPMSTPPRSDIAPSAHLPPSPPLSPKRRTPLAPVDRLLGALRLIRAGKSGREAGDWQVFRLARADFAEFVRRLSADDALHAWYQDKVRYDWEAEQERYTLRMPTAVHERFTASVDDAVVAGIARLAERWSASEDGQEVAEELKKVYKGRSATLEMCAPRLEKSSQDTSAPSDAAEAVVRRSPDASFYHPAQPDLPCLVLEVGYSQRRKHLPRLAESYVADSRHAIRCVVGLDISYPNLRGKEGDAKEVDKTATASVWRPGLERDDAGEETGTCDCHVDEVSFRDAAGASCDGALSLKLSDILPASVLSQFTSPLPLNPEITIPFADLTTFLTTAENKQPSASDSFAPTAS